MSLTKQEFIKKVGTSGPFYKILRNDNLSIHNTYKSPNYQVGQMKFAIKSCVFGTLHQIKNTFGMGNKIALLEINDDAICKFHHDGEWLADSITIKSIITIPEFLNNCTDKNFVNEIIAKYPEYLYFMNQTPELCHFAITTNGLALKYIKMKTPELCTIAVEQNPKALEYVIDQTPMLAMLAIKKDVNTLKYVKNQTDEICKFAMNIDMLALQHVRNINTELFQITSKKKFNILKHVNQTHELCRAAVSQNGLLLEFVKNEFKTKIICEIAVRQNGLAIKFVPIQTPELCQLACQNNNLAIAYINHPDTVDSTAFAI